MALPGTNDYSGRILRLVTTGTIPLANFKVKGGVWTGGTAADQFSLVDEAGRQYDWIFPSSGMVTIFELGWLSGPVTITSLPHGEVQLFLGTGK
jgi:hypothetical protein